MVAFTRRCPYHVKMESMIATTDLCFEMFFMVDIHFRIATFHLSRICCVLAAVTQRKCEFPVRHNVRSAFETLHLKSTALFLVEQWGFWQTGTPVLLRHFHSILCYQHSVRWQSLSVGRRERASGAHLVLLIWFFSPKCSILCLCLVSIRFTFWSFPYLSTSLWIGELPWSPCSLLMWIHLEAQAHSPWCHPVIHYNIKDHQ